MCGLMLCDRLPAMCAILEHVKRDGHGQRWFPSYSASNLRCPWHVSALPDTECALSTKAATVAGPDVLEGVTEQLRHHELAKASSK